MTVIQAIVLGVVQGLTEFLPVSSSAHLILVPWLAGWDEPGLAFDAAIHLGTLIAVFSFFWRELWAMTRALPQAVRHPQRYLLDPPPGQHWSPNDGDFSARLALLVAIGCVPAGIVGLAGSPLIESVFHDSNHERGAAVIIMITMTVMAVLLWLAERRSVQGRTLTELRFWDVVQIGLAQMLALIPGVSRSGSMLTAGLFAGFNRTDAARFSFLLGSPLTLAAGLVGLVDALRSGLNGNEIAAFVSGGVTSAIVGYLAIGGLLRFLSRAGTGVFVVYRLVVAAVVLAVLLSGFR